jgi:hypothetical protein
MEEIREGLFFWNLALDGDLAGQRRASCLANDT